MIVDQNAVAATSHSTAVVMGVSQVPLARRPLLAFVKSIHGTRDMAQVAWNYINDSFRTTLCLQAVS